MTREEFATWLGIHKQLFPEVAEWLAERGDALPQVLDVWFGSLSHIRAERIMKITREMVAGTLKHPADKWSVSGLPAAICAACPPRIPSIEEALRESR